MTWSSARSEPAAEPGFVGFHTEPLPILSQAQRDALGAPGAKGSVVAVVVPGGPADLAGLKNGDLLIRLAGKDAPQLETSDRYDPAHHEWRVAMRQALAAIPAGEEIEVEVVRSGKPLTLRLMPVSEEEMHRIQAGAKPEVVPPPLAQAGSPTTLASDFGAAAATSLPAGFWPYEGHGHVIVESGASPGNTVLVQDHPVLPWATLFVTGPGRSVTDGTVRVRFKPLSGVADQSGGIIFRAQDGLNYHVARPNALEDDFRIYIVKDGIRTELGSTRVSPPTANEWHTMEVTFTGTSFRATRDGKDPVEATDATFTSGWCGLWTKA